LPGFIACLGIQSEDRAVLAGDVDRSVRP
jgi:hypothetical protein